MAQKYDTNVSSNTIADSFGAVSTKNPVETVTRLYAHHEVQFKIRAVIDDIQIDVDELSLFVCKSSSSKITDRLTDCSQCLVLGLPVEMTADELFSFLEPCINVIVMYRIVAQSTFPMPLTMDIRRSNCLVIKFISGIACQNFIDIYNNLQFPSHRNVPPCLTVPIRRVDVTVSDDWVFKDDDGGLFNVLGSFCNDDVLLTTESSEETNAVDNSDVILVERFELPTCSVCLRRIKTTTSEVLGANGVPVFTHLFGNEGRCPVRITCY